MGWRRDSTPQGLRAALGSGLLLALLLLPLAGRGQEPDQQAPKTAAKKAEPDRPPFDLTYVPAEAVNVIAIRPNAIFHDPVMKPLARMVNESMLMEMLSPMVSLADLKLPIQDIEQIIIYQYVSSEGKDSTPSDPLLTGTVMIRVAHDFDWLKRMRRRDPDTEEVRHGDQVYYRSQVSFKKGGGFTDDIPLPPKSKFCFVIADKRTLILPSLSQFHALRKGQSLQRTRFAWAKEWKHVEQSLCAFAQKTQPRNRASKNQSHAELDSFEGWSATRNVAAMVAGVDWKDGIDVRAYFTCKDGATAKKAKRDVEESITSLRAALESNAIEISTTSNKSETASAQTMAQLPPDAAFQTQFWKTIVNNAHVTQREDTVRVHTNAKIALSDVGKLLLGGLVVGEAVSLEQPQKP